MPDGSCDVTAHVALDSCAAASGARLLRPAGRAPGASGSTGRLPAHTGDPAAYAAGLQRAADEAELLDPAGLGGFGWLVREVGVPPLLAS